MVLMFSTDKGCELLRRHFKALPDEPSAGALHFLVLEGSEVLVLSLVFCRLALPGAEVSSSPGRFRVLEVLATSRRLFFIDVVALAASCSVLVAFFK
jgi:hypothetical protein